MDLLVIEFYFIFNNILYLMTVFLGVILIKRAGDGARNIKWQQAVPTNFEKQVEISNKNHL